MIDALIALSERLEMREVRHDVRPSHIAVYANGTLLGKAVGYDHPEGYYWRGQYFSTVERVALAIALDVFNAEPGRSPRLSGRTPRAHHRRT